MLIFTLSIGLNQRLLSLKFLILSFLLKKGWKPVSLSTCPLPDASDTYAYGWTDSCRGRCLLDQNCIAYRQKDRCVVWSKDHTCDGRDLAVDTVVTDEFPFLKIGKCEYNILLNFDIFCQEKFM